jgi:hypothetical protein
MWSDPIVDEVREYRSRLAESFGGDFERLAQHFQQAQAAQARLVSLPPRPPADWMRASDKGGEAREGMRSSAR